MIMTPTMTDPRTLSASDIKRLLDGALRAPAQEGARLAALHWLRQLAEARSAWHALQTPADGESALQRPREGPRVAGNASRHVETLHRARVALRRLRAVLREHASALDGVIDRRSARALRALGQATNAMRDSDVQRTWLAAEAEGLPAAARDEAVRLRIKLDARAVRASGSVSRAFEKHFDPIADRLQAQLATYRQLRRVGLATTPTPFARHLATRIERASLRLRRDLESIQGVHSQEAIHQVRIRLKRQRAMLAPFARQLPALAAWFEFATRGQDLLGAVRDADLLAERAAHAKLPALEAALRHVAMAHYDAFALTWCKRLDEVMRTLDAAVAELRKLATPVNADGVPMEIERKYLLSACPPVAMSAAPVLIEQGWLPGTTLRERLRRTVRPDGAVQYLRTVKMGPAAARIEIEEHTPSALFDALWLLTADARVRKHRHVVADGRHRWEIDVFRDRDLVLAEVELEGIDDVAEPPAWLQPFIVRDVTGEPEYVNAVLARPDHG